MSYRDPAAVAEEVVNELRPLGKESYRKVMRKHGILEPMFGVKIEELQKIRKRLHKDYQLALELYDTGIYDAMYLAGMIADETKFTKKDLRGWLKKAKSTALCGTAVAGVAAESKHGRDLAIEWIDARDEKTSTTGWTTLTAVVSVKDDAELDLDELKRCIHRIERTIHEQPNRVRYAMNGFIIGVGCFVQPLTEAALKAAAKIGVVEVDMGDTECKVPFAPDYIQKVIDRGTIGKKRKSTRCS